jgi:cytochrome c biogenesis protein CcdA/thiol-disulfide isomerase/thioredoxin
MLQLALIGLVGGLITGISPCILPVLPVIFFSGGVQSARSGRPSGAASPVPPRAAGAGLAGARSAGAPGAGAGPAGARGTGARPYLVILGLVLSFSVFTLAGSFLLTLLHLPQDLLRWIGLVVLVLIGVGLIFERFQHLLELPFSWIPQRKVGNDKGGFLLGLALGAVYVPCAGPVLAAIAVAGATGQIGAETLVLTVTFAVGAATPLLVFALAGRRVAERVKAFRRNQRGIRITGGILMIALAVGLVFNLPQTLQRLVPDYTSSLQDQVQGDSAVQQKLNLGGLVNDQNRGLDNCSNGGTELERCGTAPDIKGIQQWFNTPGNQPVDLTAEHGKVVLVDFWAYSCINCQRSVPHLTDWYAKYKDAGLEIIGVHSPEYAFEKEPRNVMAGAQQLGISYPVAIDNNLATWTNYRNRYWPAHYLIDANGTVRHIQFGEGGYSNTEKLIRQLLQQANPNVQLPPASVQGDDAPAAGTTTPETFLGANKDVNFSGAELYTAGARDFDYPQAQPGDSFALQGPWILDSQSITPTEAGASIRLHYTAAKVFMVVAGEGELTVREDGQVRRVQVHGTPTLYQVADRGQPGTGVLEVEVSEGVSAYSFTFG